MRRWMFALSAFVHGLALGLILLFGAIHVAELPSPVRATFISVASAPPPPPPPPGKATTHAINAHRVVRAKIAAPVVIDDSDAEGDEPEGGGERGGVPGGQIGGVIGGVLGGILGGTGLPEPTPPREPPTIPAAQVQVVYGAVPPYLEEAKAAGIHGVVTAKICVTASGTVSSVAILRSLRMLDESVKRTISTWRYKPWVAAGQAHAFCHVAQFAFDLD